MQTSNTLLEDIGAVIGYTATSALCGWYGGKWLRVPKTPTESHPIAKIIGYRHLCLLAENFGGHLMFVPKDKAQKLRRRDRIVFDMLIQGKGVGAVCARVGLSKMHVHNIRRSLEEAGLLPLILSSKVAAPDAN